MYVRMHVCACTRMCLDYSHYRILKIHPCFDQWYAGRNWHWLWTLDVRDARMHADIATDDTLLLFKPCLLSSPWPLSIVLHLTLGGRRRWVHLVLLFRLWWACVFHKGWDMALRDPQVRPTWSALKVRNAEGWSGEVGLSVEAVSFWPVDICLFLRGLCKQAWTSLWLPHGLRWRIRRAFKVK